MKKFLLSLPLLAVSSASAVTIMLEDFEDSTVNYTPSIADFSDNSEDYAGRVSPSGISIGGAMVYSNLQGTGFYGASDTNGDGGPDTITLTFTIPVSGYENLSFSGLFGEDDDGSNEDWDSTTSFTVSASIDGATPTTIFAIESESAGFNSAPRVDTNFDGTGDGTEITDTLAAFSAAISGTGNSLELVLTIDTLNDGDEDIAFDNIEVSGDAVPEPASALLGGLGLLALLRRRR